MLTTSNFDFNNRYYLEIRGTVMETQVTPYFANLFLADIEDKWVYNYLTQPTIWLRHIGVIIPIWAMVIVTSNLS